MPLRPAHGPQGRPAPAAAAGARGWRRRLAVVGQTIHIPRVRRRRRRRRWWQRRLYPGCGCGG